MKPLTEWQINEILDMELRKPQWHILLDEKGSSLVCKVALLYLEETIRLLDAKP
jgi:hypothetical protein